MSYSDVTNYEIVETNKVLKNTYLLLGMNLLSASLLSYLAIYLNLAPFAWWLVLIVHIALLFAVEKTADSALGIVMCFLFTGWLGLTSGPIVNFYLNMPNGGEIVTQALAGTAIIFVCLSAWVTIRKTDIQGWGSFLSVGILSAFVLSILNILLFKSSIMSLLLSSVFMILSGAIIMWQTSAIVNGGEKNYIRATTTLFVSIYNMFMSLLNILGVLNNE